MAKTKRTKLSDQLREAIDGGPKSRYAIAKETGIGEATLSRFIHARGGLSMSGLDKIGESLGLNFTTAPPAPTVKKPKGKK